MNGRDFLRRSMERNGIGFEMKDNCFSQIEDWDKAQILFNEMLNLDWITELNRLTDTVFPSRHSFMDQREYRWSVFQSEWATDFAFRNSKVIGDIYPFFLRHAMTCTDIATIGRFLGRPITIAGNFRKGESHEITGRLNRREEGVCVNFHVGSNSVKFYNKQGSVFRVETTINDPSHFKVFRGIEGQTSKKDWQQLRKSVVDLSRRSQVSQTINNRVLDHLTTTSITKPLGDNIAKSTKAIIWKGNRHRGLDLVGKDRGIIELIAEIGRSVDGIRNKHIKEHLRKNTRGKKTEKQLTGMATRYIRLLRAHGIIKKEAKANRYSLTQTGMQVVTAIRSALAASTEKLINWAA